MTETKQGPTVLHLLLYLNQKLKRDKRLANNTTRICLSCIHSIEYILEPIPHGELPFDKDDNYSEYLKLLSKSIQRNRELSEINHHNLTTLIQTLQSELWHYK